VSASLADLRDRISSVKNTQKITDAMKLVAAAKVRRAQAAVLSGRPFSQELVRVLYTLNTYLDGEDVEIPLTQVRPVKNVVLVSVTGDRGLCGGFNSFIIKKTMERVKELEDQGCKVQLLNVGKKGSTFFRNPMRAAIYDTIDSMDIGGAPKIEDASKISAKISEMFVNEEVDKVEMIYTKFVSLIKGDPTIQTLLPLTKKGTLADKDGNSIDYEDDEIFRLTTKDGEMSVEREKAFPDGIPEYNDVFLFEQPPEQILEALLPLYMSAQILRSFQESVASELAARMSAMNTASDNAKELKKDLSLKYNRQRQAKITAEIIELCSGAA
jgi:F-type H+-transporting ATPase subunit gamma